MSDSFPIPGEATPAIPSVLPDAELLCAGCDYDLRTLSTSSRCPECGLLILKSLRTGPQLTLLDWRALHRSLTRILLANAILLATLGVFIALAVTRWSYATAVIVGCLALAALTFREVWYGRLAAAGILPNTTPSGISPQRVMGFTAHVRIALVWLIALGIASTEVLGRSDSFGVVMTIAATCLGLGTGAVQFFAVATYLETVGLRSHVRHLGRWPTWLGVPCLIAICPGALFGGIGIPVAWILNQVLLDRFRSAAAKRVRELSLASGETPSIQSRT